MSAPARPRGPLLLAAFAALSLSAAPPVATPAAPPAAPPASVKAAAATITAAELRAHVRFLSDDLLEGRGTGARGDAVAARYVAAQLEAAGLEPAGDAGTFLQRFSMTGVTSHAPETVAFRRDGKSVSLRRMEDVVTVVGNGARQVSLKDAPLVFAGYGIVAPEFRWDDFKGADVAGKVLVVMNDDPDWDPALFGGAARLRYGRWDYKYEEAARQGAAGVLLIHTNESAGYPWKVVQTSWSGESFELPHAASLPELPLRGWVTEEACRRIAALAGRDLDALRRDARSRGFHPVPLGVTLSVDLAADVRSVEAENVLARLPGSDPARAREAVLFTAHHDHLGMRPAGPSGPAAVYNGALDNATGVAALLAVARAMAALPRSPARSVYFCAVAAEEQGLLGSEYLAAHPPVPPGRIAADVNLDAMNIWGRTRDVSLVGLGKSDVDDVVRRMAAFQGRTVHGEADPRAGHFYRSDQFSLARVGVPSAYLKGGLDVVGKPAGWGKARFEAFYAHDYHQPSDDLTPEWSFDGMLDDARLALFVGEAIADAPEMPRWNPGDEFERVRANAPAR